MTEQGIVYIVDDDEASRDATAVLVGEMRVEAETFATAEAFLEAYDGRRPACLVTDVRMIGMSGLELQETLNQRGIHMATIVLTAYADTPLTVRAIRNGALTLLEKPPRNLELWDAIREGLAQDAASWAEDRRRLELNERLEQLTPSEREVLDLLVAGAPNKAIAAQLDVSIRTVEVRRRSLYEKMNADSVAELVRLVMEAKHD